MGHLQSKLDAKINVSGKLLDGDKPSDAIGYKWKFVILPERYKGSPWKQISRISEKLRNMNVVVKRELSKVLRNLEGVWRPLVKKRIGRCR